MVNWRGRRESRNVEDRRGQGGGSPFPFPLPGGRRGGMPMPGRRGGFSIWTILILLGLYLLFGGNLGSILGGGGPDGGSIQMPRIDETAGRDGGINIPGFPGSADDRAAPKRETAGRTTAPTAPTGSSSDELAAFVKVMLADTEDVWADIFQQAGRRYEPAQMVIFDGYTNTRCGPGMAAMGPFYCPLDQKVYLDLSFARQLKTDFGVAGDFPLAYVVAHEVGHHIQTILGIAERVQVAKQQNPRAANRIQVRMELQADCYAGVWARQADQRFNALEDGDIEEGLQAASAIGDDMIQRRTQGRVVPDAFTHGTSAQRKRWFLTGYRGGNPRQCDTFNVSENEL